jgi:hypothetical protein
VQFEVKRSSLDIVSWAMVYRQFVKVSTGENAGQAGQKLEQVVNGSRSRRIGAELLADADEDECGHEV